MPEYPKTTGKKRFYFEGPPKGYKSWAEMTDEDLDQWAADMAGMVDFLDEVQVTMPDTPPDTTGWSLQDQRGTLIFGVHPADTDPEWTRPMDEGVYLTIEDMFLEEPNPAALDELWGYHIIAVRTNYDIAHDRVDDLLD